LPLPHLPTMYQPEPHPWVGEMQIWDHSETLICTENLLVQRWVPQLVDMLNCNMEGFWRDRGACGDYVCEPIDSSATCMEWEDEKMRRWTDLNNVSFKVEWVGIVDRCNYSCSSVYWLGACALLNWIFIHVHCRQLQQYCTSATAKSCG
jgi:hypothetical protein